MARLAITIEGVLISSDLVEQIAATPQDVPGQRPADFGLDSRLSDEIQKAFSDALIHWNAFNARLARGKESATTITRETWILPLLEELGFTLAFQRAAATAGGSTFMLSHRLGADPTAPPVHIVSCEQEVDRKGDAARSPHALVQDYLNRSDSLWGIVTNGRRLRLLRNTVRFSKPSFIEFDLEAIFNGNLYSEFVLFYRLAHATRLLRGAGDAHECWLEKYYQQGIEQGGRVRERLRDGVQEALEILGTGLLAHPDSGGLRDKFASGRLSKIDYYRQLLRLIYRLLFLMVAEERRLLFVRDSKVADRQEIYDRWYSIERLRKRTDSWAFDDDHSDLWEGLKQTFRLFEDPACASQLGLTALDGELFGRFACADLIDTEREAGPRLRNDRLLSAIWHLSTFEDADRRRRKSDVRRRVNFGGLDVEELGSVYESLLDYHPEVKIEGERSKFELVAGTERKSTGSYYTPPELVRELIKSALEPVIEERLAKAKTRDEKERALLSLKVCDPASGSGHFMLAAARRIGRELARVRSGEAEPNPADHRHAVRDVIRRCIYAVDKNPLAVDLCKVALWIEGNEPGLPLSFLDHHVKCGDSLVGVFDLKVLEAGIPNDAYKAVTGDDKKLAGKIKKRNRDEAKRDSLFRHSVKQDIARAASAFGAIADLPETSPDEVRAKEAAYVDLRRGDDWERAKWACDLWTAAFFAPLAKEGASAVPTTRHVWDAIGGRMPQGRVAAVATDLGGSQPFFHWPLEFPEVFAVGGFDCILGNPPWEVSEFRSSDIASVASFEGNVDETEVRNALIARAKAAAAKKNQFFNAGRRFPLTRGGKTNLYAVFLELSDAARSENGALGLVVPLGFITDDITSTLFSHFTDRNLIHSVKGFENEEKVFPGIHNQSKFSLFTSRRLHGGPASFLVFARRIEHLQESERVYTLAPEEITAFNPDTHTAPLFRTRADKQLASKIYAQWPTIGQWPDDCRPRYKRGFYNTTTDKKKLINFANDPSFGLPENAQATLLYEGKMFGAFDHRYGTYEGQTRAQARKGVLPHVTAEQHSNQSFRVSPRYLVSSDEVIDKYAQLQWARKWVIAWRDVTNSVSERNSVAAVLQRYAFDDGVSLLFIDGLPIYSSYALALLNSLTFDYLVRQKYAGSHLKAYMVSQVPAPPPNGLSRGNLNFINERVIQLVFSTSELRFFVNDLEYDGDLIEWKPEGRALIRAELDAYYGYLYGLTRRELDYILDPKAVIDQEYPSETFRVLKENEEKDPSVGEYRTQRLVLEAWDRFAADGTFDPARLREPQYIDRMAQELTATRARLEQIEHDSKALLALASATPKPTLFVEGVTDKMIIEAAWAVFFPNEPMPVKVIAACGTTEMGSLAGKGKALREVLGDKVVLVLADNDSAGRSLIGDGHLRRGGIWRQLPNGIHCCLLKPTASFAAAMKAHNVPIDYWPFTIEAAFPPAVRRQAEAAGAWRFAGTPQAELLDNAELARRLFAVMQNLGPDDDAYWYLMAPHPEAKDSFATWVTAPEQRTEENYEAFEEIIRGLRGVLAQSDNSGATTRARGAA
jgi:N-6 DNA Methylase